MPAYSFKKQFVPKVKSGEKQHTIRKKRPRPTVVGDTLYLYFGMRTKYVEKLLETVCTNVLPVEIHWDRVKVGPDWIPDEELEAFAQSDGFEGREDFFEFWRDVHGLTPEVCLTGFELISWRPNQQ